MGDHVELAPALHETKIVFRFVPVRDQSQNRLKSHRARWISEGYVDARKQLNSNFAAATSENWTCR
jgi:hypothetical protein